MAQIDMTQSKEEAKEYGDSLMEGDAPKYPYGLKITLNDESLAKLNLTQLPAIGTKLQISATAEVCSTSAYQDQSGEAETSMSLQITAMELGGTQQSNDLASKLYGQ